MISGTEVSSPKSNPMTKFLSHSLTTEIQSIPLQKLSNLLILKYMKMEQLSKWMMIMNLFGRWMTNA